MARADQAKQLLENEIFIQAFKDVENAIFQRIRECPQRDTEGLTYLHLSLHTLESVKANLTEAIRRGKIKDFNVVKLGERPFLAEPEHARSSRKRRTTK